MCAVGKGLRRRKRKRVPSGERRLLFLEGGQLGGDAFGDVEVEGFGAGGIGLEKFEKKRKVLGELSRGSSKDAFGREL